MNNFSLFSFNVDLPTQSPLLYSSTKVLLRWQQLLVANLETFGPPANFIEYNPVTEDGLMRGGVRLQKIKALLDPTNVPFK